MSKIKETFKLLRLEIVAAATFRRVISFRRKNGQLVAFLAD